MLTQFCRFENFGSVEKAQEPVFKGLNVGARNLKYCRAITITLNQRFNAVLTQHIVDISGVNSHFGYVTPNID
jgi:hypothetical protein